MIWFLNRLNLVLIYFLYGLGFIGLAIWIIIAVVLTLLWGIGAAILFLPVLAGFMIEQQQEKPAEPYRYDGVANDL